jgi:hypothetical protein
VRAVKATFLRRRSITYPLLAVAYFLVGVVSWYAFKALPVAEPPDPVLRGYEAEAAFIPGVFDDSWRDDHAGTCRFEIAWREDESRPGMRAADLRVTNVSGHPLWYHEWNRTLVCDPFVRRRRPSGSIWEKLENPGLDCGRGMEGDSWRRVEDGAQVQVSAAWINERSDEEVCFVISFFQVLEDGWIPKHPVEACSPVFKIVE